MDISAALQGKTTAHQSTFAEMQQEAGKREASFLIFINFDALRFK